MGGTFVTLTTPMQMQGKEDVARDMRRQERIEKQITPPSKIAL